MTRQLAQTFQCLMVRDDFELNPRESQEFKPFRGGLLLFEYVLDPPKEHIVWGAWAYRYMPQGKRNETSQDDLCPPNFKVGKFCDTQFWVPKTAYGEGPLSQGIFFDDRRLDLQSIDWLKDFCRNQGLGIANLDGFIHFVLLAPQPVRKTKAGGYVYKSDEPKVIFSYDLDESIELLSYGNHDARNTKYDRTRHGQPVYEMCECQSKRRNGERMGPCNHASDVLVKELGDVYSVECYRRVIYKPQDAKSGHITCNRSTPNIAIPKDILKESKSAKLLEFIPAERLFGALDVKDVKRPDFESVPSAKSVEKALKFLGALHDRYLFARAKFESYQLPLPIWKVYTGGSLAKAMLRKFGIKPFREQNPDFNLGTLSCFRAADYGGRVETLVTLKPVLSAHLDFCSQYPAVASLLGIQRFLVAENVKPLIIDRLPGWMASLNTERLMDRSLWPHLCGVALVRPNGDFLPFRSSEGFRVRMVESGEPYWVGLPDVAASILRTGRVPEVLKTILLWTDGVQSGVHPAKFFDGKVLDPTKDDIFAASVLAKESKSIPKQAVNALAYGLHGEINPERGPYNDGLTIYCAGRKFHRKSNRLHGDLAREIQDISERLSDSEEAEESGEAGDSEEKRLYFPVEAMGEFYGPLATLVASGGRLLLQMLLDVALCYELEHVYANTDCGVFVQPNESSHRDFHARIKAVQSEFEVLSPCSRNLDFLKLKPYNYTAKDRFRPTIFFSIGFTKYVEFSLGTGIATIRHISQGGSGGIQDPDGYVPLRYSDIDIDKDALEADCPRQILADAWQVATAMVIQWKMDGVFSKFDVTEETFCTYLRERLDDIETFHHEDDEGRSYIDRLVSYFEPIDQDNPDEPIASWRQFVIGKEGRHEGDILRPLFEIEGDSITPIVKPFCDEAHPENLFFQLYMAGLWFKFVETVAIPYFGFTDKNAVLSEARRMAISGVFHFICGEPLQLIENYAIDFIDVELSEKNLERQRNKIDFLENIRHTLGLDADRYGKIKRAVRRLKGSTDWFTKLGQDDLNALDAMMNDWRSSGRDYWTWSEEKKKERKAEAEKKRQEREANKQETPEERAARRREDSAECMRKMRAAEAERKYLETLVPKVLKPADVPGSQQDFCVKFMVLKPEQTKDDSELMGLEEKRQRDTDRKRRARENEMPEQAEARRKANAERMRLARLAGRQPKTEQAQDEPASPIDLGLRQ